MSVAIVLPFYNGIEITEAYPTSFTYEAEDMQTDVGFEAIVNPR